MYSNTHEIPRVVRRAIEFCTMHIVLFEEDYSDPSGQDRAVTTDREKANAISTGDGADHWVKYVLLDIDVPAALLKSSTPKHGHFYGELPNPVPKGDYLDFVEAAARIGLVEKGYADASSRRGFTTLRLPWVKKELKK